MPSNFLSYITQREHDAIIRTSLYQSTYLSPTLHVLRLLLTTFALLFFEGTLAKSKLYKSPKKPCPSSFNSTSFHNPQYPYSLSYFEMDIVTYTTISDISK